MTRAARTVAGVAVRSLAVVAIAAILAVPTAAGTGRLPDRPRLSGLAPANRPAPLVMAYYYIWFEQPSWDRAKVDLPALGAYESADPATIAQHVAWARAAGIDALIVSWKHEPRLDGPLESLVEASRAAGIRLVLLYQGLDFYRRPLDVERIGTDLTWFMGRHGSDPVFNVFGSPTIILSGSPSFSREDVKAIKATLDAAGSALLLGSERDGASYAARADLLDGDAYYWSSVDPERDGNHQTRLDELAGAIRDDKGLWLAPVAPGFDARLIGGTRVVERADGATYRAEWTTALSTRPDALAIISWNEFSENSHIEPSRTFGTRYLELTAELVRGTLGRPAATDPAGAPVNGSGPASTYPPVVSEPGSQINLERLAALLAALLVLAPLIILTIRDRRRRPRPPSPRP